MDVVYRRLVILVRIRRVRLLIISQSALVRRSTDLKL